MDTFKIFNLFHERISLIMMSLLLSGVSASAHTNSEDINEITVVNSAITNESIIESEPLFIDLPRIELSAEEITIPLRNIRKSSTPPSIYSLPYSPYTSVPNWRRLLTNTATLVSGYGVTLMILKALPENSTAWSRIQEKEVPMGRRWLNHIKEGPVIDHDKFVFNYILHPYGGAAYYMGARSCGFNIWGSFLYSFFVSTVCWEYGFEAFMEVPSVQDLIITPVIGSLFGEGFYQLKRKIVDRDYVVLGSKFIGHFCTFLLDPINEVVNLFYPDKQLKSYISSITSSPMISSEGVGLNVSITF